MAINYLYFLLQNLRQSMDDHEVTEVKIESKINLSISATMGFLPEGLVLKLSYEDPPNPNIVPRPCEKHKSK